MRLDTQRLQTLDQIREFLADSRPLDLQPQTRAEAYALVAETPGTVRLRPPREGRQGPAPPIPGQGGRPLASAGHPPAAPAPDHGRHRRPPRPPAPLPPPLHQGRHRAARRSRRPPRHPLRSRHPPALHPGLARVRGPPLRAPRRHLQRTSLQPAPLDQLSAPPRDDARDDPPRAHRHRRAAPAPALRTTRLPAGGFRPSRRPRRHQGPLPPQPRRRGHPVPVRRLGRAHRDALPRPRPRRSARGVPLHRPRIPRRQRFGVHQPATSPAGTRNASTPSLSRCSPPT